MKSIKDNNDKDRIIVIDNTEFPKGGSVPQDSIVLEYSCNSFFLMKYNLRDTSIYMGIASLILCFIIGTTLYLGCKIRRDIKSKFLADEEDEGVDDTDSKLSEGDIDSTSADLDKKLLSDVSLN